MRSASDPAHVQAAKREEETTKRVAHIEALIRQATAAEAAARRAAEVSTVLFAGHHLREATQDLVYAALSRMQPPEALQSG